MWRKKPQQRAEVIDARDQLLLCDMNVALNHSVRIGTDGRSVRRKNYGPLQ